MVTGKKNKSKNNVPKRHQKQKVDPFSKDNIRSPSLKRLMRRAGIRRISAAFIQEAREMLRQFLENVIPDCVITAEYFRRKTITASDVVYVLKRHGRKLYGFEEHLTKHITKKTPTTKKPAAEAQQQGE